MIALNELLKELEAYNNTYKLMGQKTNLTTFVKLENKLRNAGLAHERSRALCNKKCGELIKKQSENKETFVELKEIKLIDKKTLKLQAKYNNLNKTMNKKLRRLKNLPDKTNLKHLQIETANMVSTIGDFKTFLENSFKPNTINKSVNSFLKKETEKLYEQNTFPQITYCKNGIVVFSTKETVETLLNSFLYYFKNNALSIIEHSITQLKKSSAQEFLIHLNKNLYIKLELKREFLTREYKIKYHDKSTDMTKFANQINILF